MSLFRLIHRWILLLSRPESLGTESLGIGPSAEPGAGAEPGAAAAQAIRRLGLDSADLERLAAQQGWDDASPARVLEKLGFEIDPVPDARRGLFFHALRVLVAGVVFLGSTYFVAGAIWEGQSSFFGESRWTALVVLTLLLAVLGVFEGLQICVALLRFKDIDYFHDRYPRAAALHRWFRTEAGTRRFLAGRQFFVVFVVFFIARIKAFPGLRHVPLVGWTLPTSLDPLWFALFDLGLAGAFLVLWVAQLAPQFGANRDPLAFLELPGMGTSLRACFVVDDTGVTLPGFWLSSWVPERRKIPNSRSERYRLAREEGLGAAANLVRHRVTVRGGSTTVRVEKRFQLNKGGFDAFDDRSVEISSLATRDVRFEFDLMRGDRTVPAKTSFEVHPVERKSALTFELAPEAGAFEAGDRAVLRADIDCDGLSSHVLTFEEPTRLAHVILEIEAPKEGASADVSAWVQRYDSHLPIPDDKVRLETERRPDVVGGVGGVGGVVRAEYFCVFPRPGEMLRFNWR